MTMISTIGVLYWMSGLGCTGQSISEQVDGPMEPEPLVGTDLSTMDLARRLSLDIRGEFLGVDEVARLQDNPDLLPELMATWFEQQGHQEQLVDFFSSMLLTKVDEFNVTEGDFYLEEDLSQEFVRSIGEEAPRFMAHIASSDVPWSQVVTADYTIANGLLQDIWELEPVDANSTEAWQPMRYTDGRPALGVLSTNSVWWRYYTTPNNKSRARAAFVSRLLVCDDILTRTVVDPPNVQATEGNQEDLIKNEPACVSCHQTLDPLAAALYGFWQNDMHDVIELSIYHPEREWDGERDLENNMGWYGKTLRAPADLGTRIAEDERFLTCAAERLAERLWRREISTIDEGRIDTIVYTMREKSETYRALFQEILNSPEYRLGFDEDPSDPRSVSAGKMMTAHQIRWAFEEFTGFHWEADGVTMLDNDEYGYRVLLGGIDGRSVNQWQQAPSLTRQLTLKRLAQLSADYAVSTAVADSNALDIFLQKDPTSITVQSEDFAEIIRSWHWRLMGRDITEEELALYRSNFSTVEAQYGIEQGWVTALSVALRNSHTWIY